jgi:cytoskeletal protein RodZ
MPVAAAEFGSRSLRSIREAAGVSLVEISELTKIRVSLLEAIEEQRLEELPGGLYTISYVRQYARLIGMNEEEVLRTCLPSPPETLETEAPVVKDNVVIRLATRMGSGLHLITWMQRFSSFLQ